MTGEMDGKLAKVAKAMSSKFILRDFYGPPLN